MAYDLTRVNGEVQALQSGASGYAVDTGTANTIIASLTPTITALTDGMRVWFKAANTNNGATTLRVGNPGASPLVNTSLGAMVGGEIQANSIYSAVWNSTSSSWVLQGQSPGLLINIQTITATGTYTPTPGARNAFYRLVGGGSGGGAGANGNTDSTTYWTGGGGGGGGGAGLPLEVWGPAVSAAVTIGAGGAGGATGTTVGGDGSAGGSTSVAGIGSTGPSFPGGGGGGSTVLSSTVPGRAPLSSSSGATSGTPGTYSLNSPGQSGSGNGGTGGSSIFGPGASGGRGGTSGGGSVGIIGYSGTSPGAGGGGGGGGWQGTGSGYAGGAGGAGAHGQVVIYEYA